MCDHFIITDGCASCEEDRAAVERSTRELEEAKEARWTSRDWDTAFAWLDRKNA